MNLVKTSFLTAISTFIKIMSGFIVNKIVALYIGPAGLAMMGQFQNFITIVTTFANGAINNGIVKYTAQYSDNRHKQSKILSTAFAISFICAIIISGIVIFFNKPLSVYFLKSAKYSNIFFIFGFTLVAFSLNSFFISVLNGHKEIRKYVSLNIISSIVSLIFIVSLVYYLGLYGALLSLATAQSVVFIVTVFFVLNSEWFDLKNLVSGFDTDSLKKLGKFSLMALTTTLTLPVSQILVRNYITSTISMDAAGFWQGTWKISEIYLMVITASLNVYYLPRLSEITDNKALRKEIFSGYKIILPIVTVLAFGIFTFKDYIIKILFSGKFLAMSGLFGYQLMGDFFKIASWLLAYLMLAKAMTSCFIFTEIISSVSLVLLSVFFINKFGLVGATQAFALNYFLYFLMILWIFRKIVFQQRC